MLLVGATPLLRWHTGRFERGEAVSAIITYTANPAIDVWAQCDTVVPTEKTRVRDVRYDPGGGGINVARVLTALGASALPIYLAGGATGPLFETLLKRTVSQSEPITIEGDTRLSEVIYEQSTGRELRFVAEGPVISAPEAVRVLDHIRLTLDQARAGDWFVASGSLPRGLPARHYLDLADMAHAKGLFFALDCSGEALHTTCRGEGRIDLLKLSKSELGDITLHPLTDRSSVERAALELVANGRIARVLVSLGPNGALLADSEGLTFAPAIPIEVKSTVGAGDSFLGGFLFGLVQGATAAEALAMAIKAGSAACLNPGTQLVDKEEFERLGQGF